MEGLLIVDSSDGINGKFEYPIELRLVEEDHPHVAIVKTSHNNYLIPNRYHRHEDSQLLIVQTCLARLEIVWGGLLLRQEIRLLVDYLEEVVLMLPQHEEEVIVDKFY